MASPIITGTHASSTTAGAPVMPFTGVAVTDLTPGATETLSITSNTLGLSTGTLTDGAGYTGPHTLTQPVIGQYQITGTAAQVTQELDALVFTPDVRYPGTSFTFPVTLEDLSSSNNYVFDQNTVVTSSTPPDTVSLSPQISYQNGVFTLTGHASSAIGVNVVGFDAVVDGVPTHLGDTTVDANGNYTFSDRVGPHTQTFITATNVDSIAYSPPATAAAPFSLEGGLGPNRRDGQQKSFGAGEELSTAVYRPNGQRFLSVEAAGQTVDLGFNDVVANHRQGGTDFVFSPGDGLDVVGGFKLNGADHDTLQLPAADFQDFAAVLRATRNASGGAVVTDPRTGDAVQLVGLGKAELKAHPGDFSLA